MIVVSATADQANTVIFYITNTAGGTSVDLDKTVITYTDSNDLVTQAYGATNPTLGTNGWVYAGVINSDGVGGVAVAPNAADNLLESGEKYRVDMDLGAFGASAPGLNEQIKIEVKPPEGAVLVLQKTMPPALAVDNSYSVY